MSESAHTVALRQQQDYRFEIVFDPAIPALQADAAPPLGQGAGPNPEQLLAAAVGNCLSASLLFALRKFRQAPDPISAEVRAEIGRNAEGRARVLGLHATLRLGVAAAQLEHLQRALDTFEAYCTVTASVRAAIPVTLEVFDSLGARLK
ncbi:MAG: OsmC family protein [Burkholderiales bacterium]|nr:OsmC family protein [Burkholderiales bacterium]MDE2395877.1 OsmC family protein [Burkholderiales bacterium]MDE2454237.1 OsmC family protein [Burkholderiales bacterium]